MAFYAVQTGTSTVTSNTFITGLTLNVNTSADTGNTYYQLMYRHILGSTGTLAAQELRIRLDGVEVSKWKPTIDSNNKDVAIDFMRLNLSPGNHSITFEHRLYAASSGATGTLSGTNLSLQKIALV